MAAAGKARVLKGGSVSRRPAAEIAEKQKGPGVLRWLQDR